MVRVTGALVVVERQAVAVAIVLVASGVAAVVGLGGATAAAVGAAVVLAPLVVAMATLLDQRRRLAVDLIAEGRGALPHHAVAREGRRLCDPRARVRLARSYEHLIEEALGASRLAPGPPMVWPWVAAAVAAELGVAAELLRAACPDPRGVALAQRLLTDGESALYGTDVVALREELGRVRFFLCS